MKIPSAVRGRAFSALEIIQKLTVLEHPGHLLVPDAAGPLGSRAQLLTLKMTFSPQCGHVLDMDDATFISPTSVHFLTELSLIDSMWVSPGWLGHELANAHGY